MFPLPIVFFAGPFPLVGRHVGRLLFAPMSMRDGERALSLDERDLGRGNGAFSVIRRVFVVVGWQFDLIFLILNLKNHEPPKPNLKAEII